ncbi:MAG: FtsW/RodA/SpoVE family cell cycle protein [Bacteroidales bacterium]
MLLQSKNIGKHFKGDRTIWLIITLLAMFSLLVVYSSTAALVARSSNLSPLSFVIKQFAWFSVGFVILFVLSRTSYPVFMGFASLGFWIAVALLLLTLIVGQTYNQAVRSLFGFQPAEFAKVALIVFVAKLLTIKQDVIRDFKKGCLSILAYVILIFSLIFLSNFSTSVILLLTCFTMMFVARVRLWHLFVVLLSLSVTLAIGVAFTSIVSEATIAKRTQGQEITGSLYIAEQIVSKTRLKTIYGRLSRKFEETTRKKIEVNKLNQAEYSRIAIASSGILFGKGPGNSTMRYHLPEAFSDFVFAIVVEEYGVLIASVIILFYFIILYRIGLMVRKATRLFPAILAIGIGAQIALQVLVNISVATGLMPVTGQNLPLISQGGSSIISTCVMFGILLSVSRTQMEMEEFEKERAAKLLAEQQLREQDALQNQVEGESRYTTLSYLNN